MTAAILSSTAWTQGASPLAGPSPEVTERILKAQYGGPVVSYVDER